MDQENKIKMKSKNILSNSDAEKLFEIIKNRFTKNKNRSKDWDWSKIQKKLESNPAKLWSLYRKEETCGEPDVVSFDKRSGLYTFVDCSKESPKDRRSFCYDNEALESRKEHKPKNSAVGMAKEMGIEILSEDQYRQLQKIGNFDTKTSSWLKTPSDIRNLGGAIFGDFRYGQVFIYHNGAESYYGVRGFRGFLEV